MCLCVWSWCDSPDVHGLMVSPRLQPPLLRPSHMVRHSQQTPALQDTTPADQTSWHTDGHPNTTPRYLDGVVPSAVEKSACAEAETTKIRSVIYENAQKERFPEAWAHCSITRSWSNPRVRKHSLSVPVNMNDFSVFLMKTHIPTTLWVSRCRVGKFCWTFRGQMF